MSTATCIATLIRRQNHPQLKLKEPPTLPANGFDDQFQSDVARIYGPVVLQGRVSR